MKLTLVVPNFRWSNTNPDFLWDYIPYNLCLLGAMVKGKAKVEVIDAYKENLNRTELYTRLSLNKPDVVGITCMIDQHLDAVKYTARVVKNLSLTLRVVVGGAAATVNFKELIQNENIDTVVRGEGENIIQDIVTHPELPNGIMCSVAGGLAYGDMPLPDYSLIDLKSYISTPPTRRSVDSPRLYPYGRVITSRGCPYGCCFCQVNQIMGRKWRGRSADSILEEIAWLKKDYEIESLVFDDDNLLFDMPRAKDIFKGIIRRDLRMPWSMIATAVNKIDLEMIKLMHKSGCKYVNIAIESGVESILHGVIHKPVDLGQAIETARLLQAYGIFVAANFIIGFPGETWNQIRDTLAYAETFGADYTKVFTATPLRHTELWDTCKKLGCLVPGNAWREGQIKTGEFDPRELTILRAFEWDRINFGNPWRKAKIARMMGVSIEGLESIRKETRRRAYEPLHT